MLTNERRALTDQIASLEAELKTNRERREVEEASIVQSLDTYEKEVGELLKRIASLESEHKKAVLLAGDFAQKYIAEQRDNAALRAKLESVRKALEATISRCWQYAMKGWALNARQTEQDMKNILALLDSAAPTQERLECQVCGSPRICICESNDDEPPFMDYSREDALLDEEERAEAESATNELNSSVVPAPTHPDKERLNWLITKLNFADDVDEFVSDLFDDLGDTGVLQEDCRAAIDAARKESHD